MKAILTITFILLVSLSAKAQEKTVLTKNEIKIENVVLIKEKIIKSTDVKTVRLYRTKNHEVLKALSFEARYNKIKLA